MLTSLNKRNQQLWADFLTFPGTFYPIYNSVLQLLGLGSAGYTRLALVKTVIKHPPFYGKSLPCKSQPSCITIFSLPVCLSIRARCALCLCQQAQPHPKSKGCVEHNHHFFTVNKKAHYLKRIGSLTLTTPKIGLFERQVVLFLSPFKAFSN